MGLAVGQTAHKELVVTESMVRSYAEITGDYNPLHFDPEFASRTRYRRLIAQGGIATGLLHALVAMDLPGPGSVFINQTWNFTRPVYIGDTIRAQATVKSVHDRRPESQIEFVVENQRGEEVLNGVATLYQVQSRPVSQ